MAGIIEKTNFSGGIKIEDINDYIGTSSECIYDVKPNETTTKRQVLVKLNKPLKINTGHFNQIKTGKGNAARITLDDCLACSGCVTTSETVLIQEQSVALFKQKAQNKKPFEKIIVTLAPQPVASFAEEFNLTQTAAFALLENFFISNFKADAVFSSNLGLDFTLKYSLLEAKQRLRTKTNLPILVTECPGWVCYAEKTLKASTIPLLSNIKSPMLIMGELLKNSLSKNFKTDAENIFHVALMPCFDKKLEAARKEAFLSKKGKNGFKLVDCVLTPIEILSLVLKFKNENENKILNKLEIKNDNINGKLKYDKNNYGALNISGGYLTNIIKNIADKNSVNGKINLNKIISNDDFQIFEFYSKEFGKLKIAKAYGFRNITNFSAKNFKKLKDENIQFVEVMACPSGCVNGGGQLRPKERGITAQKKLVKRLKQRFESENLTENKFLSDKDNNFKSIKIPKNNFWYKTKFNDFSEKAKNSFDW